MIDMNNKVKVVKVNQDSIEFEGGIMLSSNHDQDCCESHYLDFEHIKLEDFEGFEFDLSGDNFFNRIEDYGIELMPIKGHSVKVPGYGYNNGYYSSNLSLILEQNGKNIKTYDVSECQVIKD